jgi:hypothetical protein
VTSVGSSRRRRHSGQALVVLTLAVIPALLMVGLIVDGGNAWAQQRLTQNAADAGADAGATVLAKRDIGSSTCTTDACWDARVVTAVTEAGTDKGVDMQFCSGSVPDLVGSECTYYTDFLGTTALGLVGTGTIPANTAGVRAFDKLTFGTYFARIAGIDTYTAAAQAIAHFGYNQGCTAAGRSLGCRPLAFYINWIGCDKSGKSVVQDPATEVAGYLNQTIKLALCKFNGNWGWLDPCITTDSCSNTIPGWFASNTGLRDNEVQYLATLPPGSIILIPIYDCANSTATCPDPTDSSNANRLTAFGGTCNGSNCWYHIVKLGAFEIAHVYQNDLGVCGGQNSTDCLVGQFVAFVDEGTLTGSVSYINGPTRGKGGARGVQLIK